MIIKGIIDEDFTNYKKPSMYIAFPKCDFKCDREAGCSICQNSSLAYEPNIEIQPSTIIARYVQNNISKAIILGGLEPFDSPIVLPYFIKMFREATSDDIIIYTGYTEEELEHSFETLKEAYNKIKKIPNIIIKFGRFIPNQEKHYDEVLGVDLASPNQYARRIS